MDVSYEELQKWKQVARWIAKNGCGHFIKEAVLKGDIDRAIALIQEADSQYAYRLKYYGRSD